MPQLTEELQAAFAGHYAIEREISRSAMAAVFLASDVRHDRPVAIKVLDREFAGENGVERFRREIQVVARFQHPHILPLFESGEAAGALFYVMPYVEGETLRGRINREGVLAVDEAVRITSEICDALSYAHAQGIVHRDIKPENILLNGPHALVLDFGIARLLQRTGTGSVTASGIVVGTPAYMSPEQASGEFELDGRSDIYSLACVLYEMLSGTPPHHSRSPQMMLAARLQTPARPLRELGRPIPPVLDAAVQRALALDPRDRYTSANEFAAALQLGLAPVTPYPTVRAPRRRLRPWIITLLIAIAALVGFGTWQMVRTAGATPALDSRAVVVLPMLHRAESVALPLDGDNCARLLYDAFSRWTGIRVVNDMVVRDIRERNGGSVKSVSDAVRIGREVGARYVAWGEVTQSQGETRVRVSLYDVAANGASGHQAQILIAGNSDLPQRFASLADSLLRGVIRGAAPAAGLEGSRDFDAVQLYASAHAALDAWNLAAAESLFRAASRTDTSFAQSFYHLAQVLSWEGREPDALWRSAAARAVALGDRLGAREKLHAEALSALGDLNFQGACDRYRLLQQRDSLDFAAWFGLGECQSRDRAVVRTTASPSGFAFRSSQHAAIEAYRRAFTLVPAFQQTLAGSAFQGIQRLLFAETNRIRVGQAVPPDTGVFAAYPQLEADTLAFVPYPTQRVFTNSPEAIPATHMQAIDRNRRMLTELAASWARLSPDQPLAHEALSLALESGGALSAPNASGSDAGSALDELEKAQRLAKPQPLRIRLTATKVRLLVKSGALTDAARLADSLLASTPSGRPESAQMLAGVAALTGRVFAAARWARAGSDSMVSNPLAPRQFLPLPPLREASALLAYAAAGDMADSVRVLSQRVDAMIARAVAPAQRLTIRRALLDWPLTLAWPDLGPSPLHRSSAEGNVHMEAEWALARADSSLARAKLAQLEQQALRERPGDAGYDSSVLEAQLYLRLGDSVTASTVLDRSLDAVATSGVQLVASLAESAGYARALALRADLARARGDSAVARRWATSYVQLARSAEGGPLTVLRRMQLLSGGK